MPAARFEEALQEIARRFAMEVVELIRTTTVKELAGLGQPMEAATAPAKEPTKPTKRRGRPPKAKTEAAAVEAPKKSAKRRGRPPKAKPAAPPPVAATRSLEPVAAEIAPPAEKVKKKRNWPKCSVEGCGKNFYGPSGKKRLCYGHHLDASGKQSPLLAARKGRAAADATEAPKARKATKAAKKPKKAKPAVAKTPEVSVEKPKKKRAWPTCSVEGCAKNVYMPSGARKMCYAHNMEHGGAPTPLAKVNKARKKAGKATSPSVAGAPKADKKPKTVRRKKTNPA